MKITMSIENEGIMIADDGVEEDTIRIWTSESHLDVKKADIRSLYVALKKYREVIGNMN